VLTSVQGELAHRLVKRLYRLTNKRSATGQIGNRVRREEKARLAFQRKQLRKKKNNEKVDEGTANIDLADRYHVSRSKNDRVDLYNFIQHNERDPAIQVSCSTISNDNADLP